MQYTPTLHATLAEVTARRNPLCLTGVPLGTVCFGGARTVLPLGLSRYWLCSAWRSSRAGALQRPVGLRPSAAVGALLFFVALPYAGGKSGSFEAIAID